MPEMLKPQEIFQREVSLSRGRLAPQAADLGRQDGDHPGTRRYRALHFEFIAGAATQGIAQVATATGVPMAYGVLTTLTEEQARERAGRDTETNKGYEAAQTAVAMATLMRQLATLQREART